LIDVKTMKAGESFGELALINDAPRAATIHCQSKCFFAVINKLDYDKFLKRMHHKQLQKDIDLFYSLPYFSHWTNNMIKKLVLCFNVKEFKRNQIVYSQDQEANTIYIVR